MRLDSRPMRWLAVLAVVAAGVVAVVWIYGDGGFARDVAKSLIMSMVFLVIGAGLLELTSSSRDPEETRLPRLRYGFLGVALGKDGRLSTSKTVVAAWTLVLGLMLVFLSGIVIFAKVPADTAFGADWNEYFLLLGGPFAAAVAAKGIVVKKLQDNPATKTVTADASRGALGIASPVSAAPLGGMRGAAPIDAGASKDPGAPPVTVASSTAPASATGAPTTPSGASVKDVLGNDEGGPDLVDTQYVMFSVVALMYVIGVFVADVVRHVRAGVASSDQLAALHLPAIPSALLGLTSAAALTYVGNKAVQQSGVRLVKAPLTAARGEVVPVLLANAGVATLSNSAVLAAPAAGNAGQPSAVGPAATPTAAGGITTLTFQAPATSGLWDMTVQVPGGQTTPFRLEVT